MVTQSLVAVSEVRKVQRHLVSGADGGETEQPNFHSYWELNSYKLWVGEAVLHFVTNLQPSGVHCSLALLRSIDLS